MNVSGMLTALHKSLFVSSMFSLLKIYHFNNFRVLNCPYMLIFKMSLLLLLNMLNPVFITSFLFVHSELVKSSFR